MVRKKPDFTGVPGTLCELVGVPETVSWGKKGRLSPYDPLLLQLQKSGSSKCLKFSDIRAKPALNARAKKLGIKIVFGEQGSTLYVALQEKENLEDSNGKVTQPKALPLTEVVLEAIKIGKKTAGYITTWARANGAPGIGITAIENTLSQLAREKKIKLMPVKDKFDTEERWILYA